MRPRRFGYLVPEFPGATHTFFRRELDALEALGAQVSIVSTRRPDASAMCHPWAARFAGRTTYLAPFRAAYLLQSVQILIAAFPHGWLRCAKAIVSAKDLGRMGRLRLLLLLPFAAELVAWARRSGIDHVHCHFCADGSHVAMFARLLGGPTYSISLHGALRANGGNQANKWRHASFGIAVTRTLLESARAELGDAAPETWGVAPMGVDTELFRRETPYEAWTGRGPVRLFSCGRLDAGKAPDVLIRAAALLVERGLDVRLRIAGKEDGPRGSYRRALESLAASLGIADRVSLLGATSEEGVQRELGQAHAFALASLDEALGVATMEAMAMGVPAVATRVGGVPELIESGACGLLVEPGDPVAMADALEAILRDPDLATAFSRAGESRIRARFHTFRSARQLLSLLGDEAEPALAAPAVR